MYTVRHGRNEWVFHAWKEVVEHIVDHSIPFDANDPDDVVIFAAEEHPGVQMDAQTARGMLIKAQSAIRADVDAVRAGVDEGFDAAYDGWVIRWTPAARR